MLDPDLEFKFPFELGPSKFVFSNSEMALNIFPYLAARRVLYTWFLCLRWTRAIAPAFMIDIALRNSFKMHAYTPAARRIKISLVVDEQLSVFFIAMVLSRVP